MGLQAITLVLFTLCFFEALTLECYSCSTSDPSGTCTQTANCSSNFNCGSTVSYGPFLNNGIIKFCTNSSCVDWSVNLGVARMTSKCCSSDRCNSATDSPNGMTCPGCNDTICSGIATVKCKGDEDQCINATVQGLSVLNVTVFGCASKTFCKDTTKYPLNTPMSIKILNSTCSPANRGQSLRRGAMLLLPLPALLLFSI